jgi:hypothetical protein
VVRLTPRGPQFCLSYFKYAAFSPQRDCAPGRSTTTRTIRRSRRSACAWPTSRPACRFFAIRRWCFLFERSHVWRVPYVCCGLTRLTDCAHIKGGHQRRELGVAPGPGHFFRTPTAPSRRRSLAPLQVPPLLPAACRRVCVRVRVRVRVR